MRLIKGNDSVITKRQMLDRVTSDRERVIVKLDELRQAMARFLTDLDRLHDEEGDT